MSPASENLSHWKFIEERQGVKVYSRSFAEKPLLGFRGITIIPEPLSKVFVLAIDHVRKIEWVDRLLENRILERRSERSWIEYSYAEAPWPIANRELIYKVSATLRPKNHAKILLQHWDQGKHFPYRSDAILGKLHHSFYILTPITANTTKVDVAILVDPKGMIPKWVVNFIQKSWPVETLNNLKNYAAKSPAPSSHEYERFIEGYKAR